MRVASRIKIALTTTFYLYLVGAWWWMSQRTRSYLEGPTLGPFPPYAGFVIAGAVLPLLYLLAVAWRWCRLANAVRAGRTKFGDPVAEITVDMDGKEVALRGRLHAPELDAGKRVLAGVTMLEQPLAWGPETFVVVPALESMVFRSDNVQVELTGDLRIGIPSEVQFGQDGDPRKVRAMLGPFAWERESGARVLIRGVVRRGDVAQARGYRGVSTDARLAPLPRDDAFLLASAGPTRVKVPFRLIGSMSMVTLVVGLGLGVLVPAQSYYKAAKRCTPAECAHSGNCVLKPYRLLRGRLGIDDFVDPFRCWPDRAEQCLDSTNCRNEGFCRFKSHGCGCIIGTKWLPNRPWRSDPQCINRPPTDAERRALKPAN